ncbi:hypothetical protein G6F56_005025 [Rhizopus delemar]|nr:hypothetical protein G6F56_005025 [Rhizopus delemar]
MEISGHWTAEEMVTSINARELKAILFALKMHSERFQGKHILVFTDNIIALKYSAKAGGTASPVLQELALEIQKFINHYNMTVTYSHIPGKLNIKADALSRKKVTSSLYETTMPQKWFKIINQTMGPLKLSTRSRRRSNGCIPPDLAEEGPILVPAMAINTTSLTANSGDEIEGSGLGDSMVADTILVPVSATNETSSGSFDFQGKKGLDSSRMALISNKWSADGVNEETQDFFLKAHRSRTHRAYNGSWKKFSNWCQKQPPVQDPTKYSVTNVLSFLMENNRLSSQTLNDYRSAIASVYSKLHPNSPPLASHPDIVMFFKAKKDTEIRIPSIDKLETWDFNVLIVYIRKELSPSIKLTLRQLQLKVILLMCINTMWRPRSDVGRIQVRDVEFMFTNGTPDGARLHIRQPKETNNKSIQLGLIQDEEMCTEDPTLFLGYLEADSKPITSVQPSTVGKWVQTAMEKAGVDIKYKAHSLRSATSTKAVMLGVSMDQVKDHANWSKKSDTFERYYYKLPRRLLRSNRIQQSIFSNTENNTTLEDETEPTRIVLGTTYNTNVGEEEPENVVRTHPWYRRFLW